MAKSARTVIAGVVLNLCVFIGVASAPAFQELHHHWIFPVLGVLTSAQWALAGGLFRFSRLDTLLDLKAARSAILFMLGILLLMGVVRHQTILACFGRCSFKLAFAAALSAAVYAGQARLEDGSFWNPVRASTAALACGLWAVFLALYGLGLSALRLDIVLALLAVSGAFLWRYPAVRMTASAVLPVLFIRHAFTENGIIVLNVLIACFGVAAVTRLSRK